MLPHADSRNSNNVCIGLDWRLAGITSFCVGSSKATLNIGSWYFGVGRGCPDSEIIGGSPGVSGMVVFGLRTRL